MANYLILNQNYIQDGLGTLSYIVPADGTYNVASAFTMNAPSSLVVLVKKNGSTVFTAPSIASPSQSSMQFKTDIQCVAADVITVVYSSSAAIDNQLNSVQSVLSIGQGM